MKKTAFLLLCAIVALMLVPYCANAQDDKPPKRLEKLDTSNGKAYIVRTVEIREEVPDSASLYDRKRQATARRDSLDKQIQQIDKMILAYRKLNRPNLRPPGQGGGKKTATGAPGARRGAEFPTRGIELESVPGDTLPATVIRRVHDGDSYYLVGMVPENKFCRAEGFDCPEIRSPYVSATQPYGVEIGDSVRLLLKGKTITYSLYGIGKHNRPMVSVYVDGEDIGEVILSKGWAWYYAPNNLPSAVKKRYKALERAAKKAKLGLWADPDAVRPEKFRKAHPPIR